MNEKKRVEMKTGYFQKGDHVTTLYLGNLSYNKSEKDVQKLLENFGKVKYVKIVVDPATNKSKGIAFAQMINKKHADLAIEKLNLSQLDGRTLKVSIANNKMTPNRNSKGRFIEKEVEEIPVEDLKPTRPRRRDKKSGLQTLFNHLSK